MGNWESVMGNLAFNQLPITNYQLPITNYQLLITNYQLPFDYAQGTENN